MGLAYPSQDETKMQRQRRKQDPLEAGKPISNGKTQGNALGDVPPPQ